MTTLTQLLGAGKLRAPQLSIGDVFSFSDALKQRGLENIRDGDIKKTLVSPKANLVFDVENVKDWRRLSEEFLKALAQKTYRTKLRKHIYEGGDAPKCGDLGTLSFSQSPQMEQRYTKTVELLLSYLSITTLGAMSSGFGIKIDDSPRGSDFDCIASFRDMLLYFEVKSGINIEKKHIEMFIKRHCFLNAELSVMFVDFSKIDEDIIRKSVGLKIYESYKINHIRKLSHEDGVFYTLQSNLILVDLHKSGNIDRNLRRVMRYFWGFEALSRMRNYHQIDPEQLGFTVDMISGARDGVPIEFA